MRHPLWSWSDLVAATRGEADGTPGTAITGFSIDTRSIAPGEVFVALKDQRDGHEFVAAAFERGAAAALVSASYQRKPGDGALLRVGDTLEGLRAIGAKARSRLDPQARVVAVTGSVGKTGTKEMLRAAFSRCGATHAPEKSFNNHWGVPLTLARMPAATRFGVFEIGMNHAGEITPLTTLVRPDIAIVTTVEPVHLEFFGTVAAIAEAKAEIFAGLVAGGTAILPRDNAHFALLHERASAAGAAIVSFGASAEADVRLCAFVPTATGSRVAAEIAGQRIAYDLGIPGRHIAMNSLAVLAALTAAGAELATALPALASLSPAEGRGVRLVLETGRGPILLIDESYNANPASMRAALANMASVPREAFRRRIAVMGDMLELGPAGPQLHESLIDAVDAAGADLVFACGPNMAHLYNRLPITRRGGWAPKSEGIATALVDAVRAGDVVMVKGSLGSRMAPLVTAIKDKLAGTAGGQAQRA